MNILNTTTVAQILAGWIYDFKNDHGRFPTSLKDLADNKAEKRSYNPERALQLNNKMGFTTEYKLLGDNSFEITVHKNGDSTSFSSDSGKYTKRGSAQ